MLRSVFPALVLLLSCTAGSDPTESGPTDPTAGFEDTGEGDALSPGDGCDALVPTYCAYPFPSDFWTVEDSSTPTGRRVALTQLAMPAEAVDPAAYNRADGFSLASTILVHLPGASSTGLASPFEIERSLEEDSPTVILDAETGERVAHWAELDANAPSVDEQALLIRPSASLRPGGRYIVAIRGVVDGDGNALAPLPAFAALRDESFIDDSSVDGRREHFEVLFSTLSEAGITREELQLAWDFTVASQEDTTGDMLAVRDQALAWTEETESPGYTLTRVEESPADFPGMALRVEGTIEVPLFLDDPDTGGRLFRDESGAVVQNGTASYRFWLLIPDKAREEPVGLVQYGHGMLGSGEEIYWIDEMHAYAVEHGYAILGLDWVGFASDDVTTVIGALATGEMHRFAAVPDRLHQAMANFLVSARTVTGVMNEEPQLRLGEHPTFDPERMFYYGASQGGIYGGVYMALTTDITRGVLAVPGQNYGIMLERSVNFEEFETVLRPSFPGGLDIPLAIQLTQMLWDRAEPSGYSRYIREPLPQTPPHEVLLLVAVGDHQVTTLAAHQMARSIGDVPNLGPAVRELHGIETVTGTHTGSGMVELDFGESPEPVENIPSSEGEDPHGRIGEVPAAYEIVREFIEEGTLTNHCEGPCDPG